MEIAPIERAVAAIREGRMVILVDDEDRENEGDLVAAADTITAAQISFMANHARGLICVTLGPERIAELGLRPMTEENGAPLGTAFTKSVHHVDHSSVGAADRAATIRGLIDPEIGRDRFVTPGYVFPLRARRGGVLVRSGQTEGSVDLARLAGRAAAGVICEIMNPDGTMMRLPRLLEFGARYDIPVTSVAALIRYRLGHERFVKCVAQARLPTDYGVFDMRCYENAINGQVHVALTYGELTPGAPTLVRVHRADTIADSLGLDFVPARSRLAWCLQRIAAEGRGVLVYLRPDGDDDPLDEKLMFYGGIARGERLSHSRPGGAMGFHDYGVGAQILCDLGVSQIRVMSSRPLTLKGLSGFDLEIVDWVPIQGVPEDDATGSEGTDRAKVAGQ